ncbi:hypothetical protein AGMMS49531_04320 [Endomicrobiia bacterium]|nr:hypothetical protein AGMMS49531_04320 [Endomicrobiia bacterium]
MNSSGLSEVSNPSLIFFGGASCYKCCRKYCNSSNGRHKTHSFREVQALTARTVFGMPRRMDSGYDANRIIILIAVLKKRLGLPLGMQIFLLI